MAEFDITAIFKVSGIAELNASFKKVGKATKTLGKDLRAVGQNAQRFGRNIAIVGAAGAAAIGQTVIAAKDFEASFSDAVTLLDDGSFSAKTLKEGIAGLRDGVLELRQTSGESFANLNKGLFDLISAGTKADDAITALGTATTLALAGATDTAIAVDGITTAMGAFGKEAGTAEEIAQKFFTAQKAGKTTIEELASSIGLTAALAASSGVSFEELLAAVSAATTSGIKTNAAFTGVKAALSNLQKPTKAAKEEAARLGISFNATALQTLGLTGVLERASKSAQFNNESFVKLFGSVEAVNFVQAIAKNSFADTKNILSDLNNETLLATNFNNALAEKQNTLQFQLARFGGVIEALSVKIGTALAPSVTALINIFSKMIVELGPDIEKFFKGVGEKLLLFVQGVREDVPGTIKEIKSVVKEIGGALKATGAFFKVVGEGAKTFFALLEKVAFFIPGVSGKTLGLILVFGQLTGAFTLVGSLIKASISSFKLLQAILLSSGVITKTFAATFLGAMKVISVAALGASKKIIAALVTTGASMTSLTGVMSLLTTVAKGFWIALTGPVGIGIAIAATIGLIIGKLIGFETITNAIKAAWEGVKNAIGRVIDTVKGFFGASSEKQITVNVNEQTTRTEDDQRTAFASGGHVKGKGSGTSDSIMARLSNGEYVIKASAVRKLGLGFMHSINSGVLPAIKGFADGGLVNALNRSTGSLRSLGGIQPVTVGSGATGATGRPITLVLPGGGSFDVTTNESTAERLTRELRREDLNKSAIKPDWVR